MRGTYWCDIASLLEEVAKNEKNTVLALELALQNGITYDKNLAQVGRHEEVLVEGPSKKDPTTVTARTRGNRPVHISGSFDPGSFMTVAITRAAPHNLFGVVV